MRLLYSILFLSVTLLRAANQIQITQSLLDRPTLTALGVQLLYTGDDNRNATATMQYRKVGDAAFRNALPLHRVRPETSIGRTVAVQFAGSVFDLRPATSYELRIRVQDADGPVDQTINLTGTTRAVPAGPANPRTVNVASVAEITNAMANAQAGDVITIQPGFYQLPTGGFTFNSGTATNPIVLRGVTRDSVVLDGANCLPCNVIEIYADYWHIENLTIQNAEQAIRFQTAGTIGSVLRHLRIQNVFNGVNGRAGQKDFYFADNILEGRLQFPLTYGADNGANGNYYGFAIYGQGHVVAHNQLRGFADGVKIGDPATRSVDIYGNDVLQGYDDTFETDGVEGNMRVLRNRAANVNSGLSVQGIYGGPVYLIRNVVINQLGEQLKFHGVTYPAFSEPTGVYAYHNTFLTSERSLSMYGIVTSHDSVVSNNLFIGPPTSTSFNIAEWFGKFDNLTIDNNGYFPDGSFFFTLPTGDRGFANFAALSSFGAVESHGRLLNAATFQNGLNGPAAFTTFQVQQNMILAAGSLALDQGLVLANVNDFFTGSKPDLGAFELGCPLPHYGPRPAGVDESNEVFGCTEANPAPNSAPVMGKVSPVNRTGTSRTFQVNVTDPNGFADLSNVRMTVGTSTANANACAIVLDRVRNQISLYNDAGTATVGNITPGTSNTLTNALCTIGGTGSSVLGVSEENQLQWRIPVQFKNAGNASRNVYVQATDISGLSTGWVTAGTWK